MSYNLLKGKKGLIFGALNEDSIAWKVAERAVEEGAEIVLTNTPVSIRMGTINQLAEACGAIVVPADATSVPDLENLIEKTMEHFGGKFDFILHSIGMSPNVRKGRTYDDLDYDFLTKTLDISAISFHKVIQVARKKDALNDWASIVALSYIAAQRTLYGYNDMADAKALLESIARSFGYIYGREKFVRINTVSQSPTPTTAGKGVLGMVREIRAGVSSRRFEQNIMSVVPFGILGYVQLSFPEFLSVMYGNVIGVFFMSGCLAVYLAAWVLGKKILDIEF